MNFKINPKKAAEGVARLIEKSGGREDYLRIAKLIYLTDRESIAKRGIPIVGGNYYSMLKGPTISEIMDYANGAKKNRLWEALITKRERNNLKLKKIPDYYYLSESEIELLDKVVQQHKDRTTEELVDWCHKNCAEYVEVKVRQSKKIEIEEILTASRKTPAQIQKIIDEANSQEELDRLLE